LTLSPQSNRTITAVRANDRVVLRNASGLRGTFDVSLSPFRTVTLRFAADGPLTAGSVEVRYRAERTHKGRLEVRVDA
jgi:hypothetical protein